MKMGGNGIRPRAGTVATRSDLAKARAVADSFLVAHPDGRFFILTVDEPAPTGSNERIEWLRPEELGLAHLFELRLRYSSIELSHALRVSLARYVLASRGEASFLFLASDSLVVRALTELWDALARTPILLLPHHVGDLDSPTRLAREIAVIPSGIFDSGCFAVRASGDALSFLDWWEHRVRYDCRARPEEGVFYDQKWLDLAPSLFDGVGAFRHPAYGIASTNLFGRRLTERAGGFLVGGHPAAVFRLGGLERERHRHDGFRPENLDEPRENGFPPKLVEEYFARLDACRHEQSSPTPSSPVTFENGVSSDHAFRTLYSGLTEAERARFGDPYRTSEGSFFEWAVSPRTASGISPYLEAVYSLRGDLQLAFPDIHASNRRAFVDWAATSGLRETGHSAQDLRIDEHRDWTAPSGVELIPELDPRLTAMERVFRAPPLTPELVEAIKLISPHCDFTVDDRYRPIWEADQNGACWGEYEALGPLFRSIPKPVKILEIGPGMGRSLVFFSKKLDWKDSEIHAFEGEGRATKYTMLGPRFEDSYCGNLDALRYVLEYNGIQNVKLFNARQVPLAALPGPYDLLYSFYSVGFHWSLEFFLDDLRPLMHDRTIAVFTVPPEFEPYLRLEGLFQQIIDWKTAWPRDGWLKLLILSRRALPVIS